MFTKQTIGTMIAVMTLFVVLSLPVCVWADSSPVGITEMDNSGKDVTNWLKVLAKSNFMKAIFAGALFLSIILVLSPKHRTYGLVVLVFVVLIGMYSGLVDGIWNALQKWGSGTN